MARQKKYLATLATAVLALSACGSTTPPATTAGPAPKTTAAPAPSTTATASAATNTTVSGSVCSPLEPIPAGSDGETLYVADLSGDGSADTVTTYRNEASGFWYMRVEFGEGGGSVHELAESFDPQGSRVLGSFDVEGNNTPEIFVKNGGGAYTQAIILFDVDGCTVTATTIDGTQAGFLIGASISNINGLACEAGGISVLSAEIIGDGPNYEGGFTPYTLMGSVFTAGLGDGASFTGEEVFEFAVVNCPDIDL